MLETGTQDDPFPCHTIDHKGRGLHVHDVESMVWFVSLSADMVNHPPHYGAHPSGVECITITEHYNFNVGNAIKYLWRSYLKNGLEDLKKAQWYVTREIERLERAAPSDVPGA